VADLKKEQHLENVISYWDTGSSDLRSKDGRDAMVLAHVKGDDTERDENAKSVIDAYTGPYEKTLTVRAGGGAAVTSDMGTQSAEDLVLAESIAVPLTLVLLLLVFGSMVAALLPLAIGTIAIAGTFAELYVLGSVTDVSVFAINLTTALGLGLGIDYALLMVSRFREQLASGASVDDAVRRTVSTAGRTVAFSAATVAAALAALLVFPQYFLRSFGYAGVGVVVIAAVSTLFVMPALFVVLGHRVNGGRLPWANRARSATRAPLWGRLAGTVMRRPALTALPVLAVLLSRRARSSASPSAPRTNASCPRTPRAARSPRSCARSSTATTTPPSTSSSTPREQAPLESYATELSGLKGVVRVETSTGTYAAGQPRRPTPATPPSAAPTRSRSTW
jgi:RND superfamily putative drug exporter